MSLIPEAVGYEEQVQAFFLAFRGSGVSLSPLDADVLLDWKSRGVPYPVICRGIRLSAEAVVRDSRPEEARLRSLRSCRKAVESEFRRFLGRSVGRGKSPEKTPQEMATKRRKTALAKLRKASRQSPGPEHTKAIESAIQILLRCRSDDPAEVAAAIARVDDALALLYVRALPIATRREILSEARRNAGPRQPGSTTRARKDALRAHLVAVSRARGGLISLV
jgi:hypothetical protein